MYNVFADAVVVAHFLFIVFVLLGGLLVIRWPRTAFATFACGIMGSRRGNLRMDLSPDAARKSFP